jgi:hypothetical protein
MSIGGPFNIVPLKPGGVTPTMVTEARFTEMVFPMTVGSPAKRRCQKPYEMTATGAAPG